VKNENIHPEALNELEAAAHWYDDQRETLGNELLDEVKQARRYVAESPESCPRYIFRTRRFVLRRFPYSVVHRIRDDEIQIVAFAHHSRRPGYWKDRKFNGDG
jgi:plasmid stabilization system protein ParE